MQRDDINANLLAYPSLSKVESFAPIVQQPTNSITHTINVQDLGLYRIKNHCHYDLQSVSSSDYSIFQLEILDSELSRFYQGRYILEIWNKNGERIYQKVLQEELTTWKLYNNVFVFKAAAESPLIYVIWLHEKKMAAIKHPYDDHKEVDISYYDGYLIVAQQHNIRFTQVVQSDVNSYINQFMNPDEAMSPLLERDFSGTILNERVLGVFPNPVKHELIFVCSADNFSLSFYKFQANKLTDKRQVSVVKVEVDPKLVKKSKLDKKQLKLLEGLHDIQQLMLIPRNQATPLLLVLRKNQVLEVVDNFQQTIYAEQRLNLIKLLPSFGEKITFQFQDGTITQVSSFEKLASERNPISEIEYYKQQAYPPNFVPQHDLHKSINFYQDMIIINQSMFLLRDNIVFIVDTFTKQVLQKFPQKQKVMSLHKLKHQVDDDNKFKVTTYKVVAVHKSGTLQVFVPNDINLMTDWQKQEINNTPMVNQRDPVSFAFQNQNSFNYLYIVTQNNQTNAQRVYQMMFNTQMIEFSNLKLFKGDLVFSVNSVSRQREMIGIIDGKYMTIYRNDKGNLIKLYQLNHTRHDLKDQINQDSIFYFQKEQVLIITNKLIYKINIATSAIEQTNLQDRLKSGGSVLIDAQCFYFLTNGEEGSSKLAVVDTGMIDASFQSAASKEESQAIQDKDKNKSASKILYPTWSFKNQIRRLDYDEFNSILNLHLANYEIVQVPLFHRNTLHFIGMAERSFYLCFKKHGDLFYALDKNNCINCWSMVNGQLLSKVFVPTFDFKQFEMDRDVYDRNWFPYTLIYRNDVAASPSEAEVSPVVYRTYKVIDIDDKGNLVELKNFVHPHQKAMECHLYFNSDLTQMIEVLMNKNKNLKATYNLYQFSAIENKWTFVNTINTGEAGYTEWHSKTLYPYNLNLKTFKQITPEFLKGYDTYKLIKNDMIKVLNTLDGIEMVFDLNTQQLERFMALQYSFPNTKDSFYDKKCGQFYIQEINSRLQNYYEQVRRQIFLQNRTSLKLRQVDVSARDYKYKYVIEQSYTNFDHQFINQFIIGQEKRSLKIFKALSNDHIQRLVHNVFPDGGNTILHYIAQTNVGFETVDFISKLSKKEGFVVPFLINAEQLTPLDITVNNKDHKQTNSILKLLQKTPMDHHSRMISHLIPQLVEMSIPQLDKYFDKRRFQTGVCKTMTLARLKIDREEDFRSVPTTLINDNQDSVSQSLTHPKFKEQSVSLEVMDIPLHQYKLQEIKEQRVVGEDINTYEIKLIKSLAGTENEGIFQQKTIRAFIDFLWPITRQRIIKNVLLPYLAFILYYMFYLMVLKKLMIIAETDATFFQFTNSMFTVYDIFFKFILFMGCSYFLYQDFLQIKTLANNSIVLWSYANVVPLAIIITIIVYDTLAAEEASALRTSMYSASAFFVWIRVVHLLKCFAHTSYLLRMATEILYRIRWLICFIIISLLAFGFTYYFVSDIKKKDDTETLKKLNLAENPQDGIQQMFYVLLGQYDVGDFNNVYLNILLVLVACFNFFFIFTLLVSLSIVSFSKESDVSSNEAYQDKASLIALYSYLLQEQAVREPTKKYLLIATVTEGKKGKKGDSSGLFGNGGNGGDVKSLQTKMMKTLDRRMNALTSKVEKTLKDIQDRLDNVQQQRNE